ncbi:MAG: ATP synthase F1 subunit gamma [Oscillospiraceae bacterium]
MAASNTADIKRRIRSVRSTMQITRAMELVASSKLRRAKERVERSRPYFTTLYEAMSDIANENRDFSSPFTKARAVKRSAYVVIAGDRGLAGGFNTGIFRLAQSCIANATSEALVFAVGKKANEQYAGKSPGLHAAYPQGAENMDMDTAGRLADELVSLYTKQKIDEAYLFFSQYISPLVQAPICLKLLPIVSLTGEQPDGEKKSKAALTAYDPSPEAVFAQIVPDYLAGILFGAAAESYASEQGARRTAMEAANDNAGEMIDQLQLIFNRARQSAITQEISEIVAGAQALF